MDSNVKQNFNRYLLIGLATLALVVYFVRQSYSEETHTKSNSEQSVTVSAITVNYQTLANQLSFSGPIVGREEVPIYSDLIQGRIVEVSADEGQNVKAGQVLAHIDTAIIKTQKLQQEASVQHATQSVAQQETMVEEAKAQYDQSKAEKQRAQAIAETGLLSGEVIEQRVTAERLAEARLKAAHNNLGIAQSDLALSHGQLAETEVHLKQATISAPVSGTIIERKARIGLALGQSTDPLFIILKDNAIEVEFSASGSELGQLKAGLSSNIQLIGDTATYRGKVRHIASKIDRLNQTAKVRVAFEKQPRAIIGQTARVFISTHSKKAIYLPDTAIRFEGVSTFVCVVKNNKVLLTKILTGDRIGNMVEVTSGIDAGILVVDRANAFLHNGQSVKALVSKSPPL
jgi:HlyD family secretion protein